MAQVLLSAWSALWIGWRAVERLLAGAETDAMELGIGVSLLAMAGTLALLWYQGRVIARTGSVAIRTDNIHYKSDLALNSAVIAALLLDQAAGIAGADALFGIAIALWLMWGAWRGASEAVDQLMDKEWPAKEREAFLAAASEYPELAGLHDVPHAPSACFASSSSTSGFPADWTVLHAHDRLDPVEEELQRVSPEPRS